jgi:hypothetical protein
MTKLNPLSLMVKSNFRFLCIVALAITLSLLALTAVLPKRDVAAQRNDRRPTPPKPPFSAPSSQTMYAPVTGLPQSSGAELAINNNGPGDVVVSPVFYDEQGQAYPAQALTLGPAEVRHLSIETILPAEFKNRNRMGGMSLSYQGGMMEVVAQITIFGRGNAGSVDIPFSAAMDYRSTIQEAVWWMPRHSTAAIILGNDSDVSISASLAFSSGDSQNVRLAPHTTEIVERRVSGQQGDSPESLRIQTDGPTGSLRATGFVRTSDHKFTSGILFYDPQNVRQQHLFASNLRIKNAEPHLALKNISDAILTARPKFFPSTGSTGDLLELAPVTIAPGRSVEVNLSPLTSAAMTRADLDSVSVQVVNSGAAGSLIGALCAMNETMQIVWTVPLRDSGAKRNSTGGYPWKLDDDYTSIISITNVGEAPAKFIAAISYTGGKYIPAERELAVGETAFFDLRKLRDEQLPDKDGKVIPANVVSGQFHWSIVKATDAKRLIGRTEVVSQSAKVSSSFSCPVCCPDSGPYSNGFTPGSVIILVDGFEPVTASGDYLNCYGWPTYTGVPLGLHDWFCSNPAVIGMASPDDDPNTIIGLSPGQSNYTAYYEFTQYFDDGMDCYVDYFDAGAGDGGAVVVSVQFQKSDGSALPSPLRVGITANEHDRKQQLRAVVTPGNQVGNVTISVSSKLSLSNVATSGNIINFNVVGNTKSMNAGDSSITATISGGGTSSASVSVVVPGSIGTPHDTTGIVVRKNMVADDTTSPPSIGTPAGQVALVTLYARNLTITVLDQFGDSLNTYASAKVEEYSDALGRWVNINSPLNGSGAYTDPVGVGIFYQNVPAGSQQAQNWPSQPLLLMPPNPPFTQTFRVRVDGFELTPSPAISNRTVTTTPPDSVTISWP